MYIKLQVHANLLHGRILSAQNTSKVMEIEIK